MQEIPIEARALSFEEARRLIEDHAANLHATVRELTDLLGSAGLVLGEPVFADRDFPPFNRATRDGYAIRATDLNVLPATLEVIAEIKAGAPADPNLIVESGQACSIMTGAAVPRGADAIVMIEHTTSTHNRIDVRRKVLAGENIVPMASEGRRGDKLLSPGTRLDYAAIAVAASVGRTHLLVYSKPRIAILATGDEVVDFAVQPGANQIRNSNSYSLAAQVQAAGGEPVILSIAPDDEGRLKELIADGLQYDLLLISGGVSMGKYDFVETVLHDLNAELFFDAVRIQPGRPTVFGRMQNKYFLGLPGNPVSTMVTFELFARPLIEALAGISSRKLVFVHAKLKSAIKTKIGLKRFLPAILSGEFEHSEVELIRWQGSGDICATANANCYIVISDNQEHIAAGDSVPILMR